MKKFPSAAEKPTAGLSYKAAGAFSVKFAPQCSVLCSENSAREGNSTLDASYVNAAFSWSVPGHKGSGRVRQGAQARNRHESDGIEELVLRNGGR